MSTGRQAKPTTGVPPARRGAGSRLRRSVGLEAAESVESLSERLAATVTRFTSKLDGNVALLAAAVMPPILLAVGLAIDAANMVRLRSDVQAALDAGTMQIALNVNSGKTDDQLDALGTEFMLANLTVNHPQLGNVSFDYLGMSSEPSGLQTLSAAADYEYSYLIPRTWGGRDNPSSTHLAFETRISSTIGDSACIYALSETASRAVEIAGSTNVSIDGCVIASNSTAADSIYIGGSGARAAACQHSAGQI